MGTLVRGSLGPWIKPRREKIKDHIIYRAVKQPNRRSEWIRIVQVTEG